MIQWLLNNVNPELFEIQSTLQRMEKSLNLDCSGIPYEKAPTDLVQVLEQVELAERHIAAATRALVATYTARKMPTTAPSEVISGTDKFEKVRPRLPLTPRPSGRLATALLRHLLRQGRGRQWRGR